MTDSRYGALFGPVRIVSMTPDPERPDKLDVTVEMPVRALTKLNVAFDTQEEDMPEKTRMWMAHEGSVTGGIKSTPSEAALDFFEKYPNAGEYITVTPGSEIADGIFIANITATQFSGMTRARAAAMQARAQSALELDDDGVPYADYWLCDRSKLPEIVTLRQQAGILGFGTTNLKVEVAEFHVLPVYTLFDGDLEIGIFNADEICKTREGAVRRIRDRLLAEIRSAQAAIEESASLLARIEG